MSAPDREGLIREVIDAAIAFLDATENFVEVDAWRAGQRSEKLRKARERLNRALAATEGTD